MFYVGLDLGKRRDYSAIAIVERQRSEGQFNYVAWRQEPGRDTGQFLVRYVERIKLGTSYTEVVRRVVEVVKSPKLGGQKRLSVDATGVGTPVVDMLMASRPGCEVMAVTLTSGLSEHHDGKLWHVPKLDLMVGLQQLLEQEQLGISRRMRGADVLVRELLSVKAEVRESRRVRIGAEGTEEHDDLVIAVGLACWSAKKSTIGEKGQRLFW